MGEMPVTLVTSWICQTVSILNMCLHGVMSIAWLLDVSCVCRGKKEYTLPYFLKFAAAVKEKASSLSTQGILPQSTMCLNAATRSKDQCDATLILEYFRLACFTMQSMAF